MATVKRLLDDPENCIVSDNAVRALRYRLRLSSRIRSCCLMPDAIHTNECAIQAVRLKAITNRILAVVRGKLTTGSIVHTPLVDMGGYMGASGEYPVV